MDQISAFASSVVAYMIRSSDDQSAPNGRRLWSPALVMMAAAAEGSFAGPTRKLVILFDFTATMEFPSVVTLTPKTPLIPVSSCRAVPLGYETSQTSSVKFG